jgi:two-component system chemotaxis response regulator CheB
MIDVLVADDSPTARALLVAIFSGEPALRVVGEARDGAEAVALTRKLRPQVVTMDLRMPRLDGLEATREIMMTAPTPVVIVTASVGRGEVEGAMHALRAGAVYVLRKPDGPASPDFDRAAAQLVTIVKAMAQVKVVRHRRPPAERPPRPVVSGRPRAALAAVAASTGGPAALERLLGGLPGDFPAPLLVVQHIARGFTGGLADWLSTVCPLRVKVAEAGEVPMAGTVYLAPDDRHLGVSGEGTVVLSGGPPVGGFRPSGTYLFESVARCHGAAAAAVILTGMGEDGLAGLRAVRQAGGRVLAQDEGSCVVFGMPGVAVAAGLPEFVGPPDALAARLVEMVSV